MRTLGIESSSTVASVAIMEDDNLICEYTINNTLQHSKTLMPMLEEITKRVGMDIKTIDLIAVSEGPGSFTGLRIGSATAKGIAHGLKIPIASVPSLEVLAGSVMIPDAVVYVMVHARANELYFAKYRIQIKNNQFFPLCMESITSKEISEVIEDINSDVIEGSGYLIGDGVEKFKKDLELLDKPLIKMPNSVTFSAKTVALLGIQRYYSDDVVTYYEQKPFYLKKSQAEREYEEKNNHD